jgi:hypothetical protein
MTPNEIAQDERLLMRFQDELAYADRARPTDEEIHVDGELLHSPDAVLLIAWLWPEQVYLPDHDPFALAEGEDRSFWQRVAADSQSLDFQQSFERTAAAVDRRRQQRRAVASDRFARITEAVSMTLGCSVDDVMTHLMRATPLTEGDVEALQRGRTPVAFSVIVGICNALQLQFAEGAWELVDPQRLARRIEQSVIANAISRQLRLLSRSSLESVAKKVPKGSVEAGEGQEFEAYRAPQRGARYRSFFEVLAADPRDDPEYPLEEINRILTEAGENPLPPSAKVKSERSWWAGSGTKSEGRPQVSAWWGAGYRVGNIVIPLGSDEIESIIFRALPGRQEWLADPDHASSGEYPALAPVTVSIYPDMSGVADALLSFGRAVQSWAKSTELDDPAIRILIQFLRSSGEVDREAIEGHFAETEGAPVDASWMSNLLTRARRQGWIVNNGTRGKPRWATTLSAA